RWLGASANTQRVKPSRRDRVAGEVPNVENNGMSVDVDLDRQDLDHARVTADSIGHKRIVGEVAAQQLRDGDSGASEQDAAERLGELNRLRELETVWLEAIGDRRAAERGDGDVRHLRHGTGRHVDR